jgi:hypothetical protein
MRRSEIGTRTTSNPCAALRSSSISLVLRRRWPKWKFSPTMIVRMCSAPIKTSSITRPRIASSST